MSSKHWLPLGALLGAIAVMAGAFGAHGLEGWVESGRITPRQFENFETAVRYLMYHSLALVAVGLVGQTRPTRMLNAAGGAFLLGVVLFSGLLAGYSLTGVRVLAMIVPLGGLSFIAGWVLLGLAAWSPSDR